MARNSAVRMIALGLSVSGPAICTGWSQTALPAIPATVVTDSSSLGTSATPEIKLNPPQVTCTGGSLTIRANSSTMGSVLDAVHQCLGIAITAPGTPSYEPVFLQLGPGPASRVLNELLGMTDYDYVVLSARGTPEKILKVELLARGNDVETAKSATPQSTEGMSPARIAWLATRNIGRGMPPKEGDLSQGEEHPQPESSATSAPVSAPVARDAAKTDPAEGVTAPAAETASPAGKVPAAETADASAVVSAPVPAPVDANQPAAADKELQNKINDMQHLFEQRKKLNASATDTNGSASDGSTPPSDPKAPTTQP